MLVHFLTSGPSGITIHNYYFNVMPVFAMCKSISFKSWNLETYAGDNVIGS